MGSVCHLPTIAVAKEIKLQKQQTLRTKDDLKQKTTRLKSHQSFPEASARRRSNQCRKGYNINKKHVREDRGPCSSEHIRSCWYVCVTFLDSLCCPLAASKFLKFSHIDQLTSCVCLFSHFSQRCVSHTDFHKYKAGQIHISFSAMRLCDLLHPMTLHTHTHNFYKFSTSFSFIPQEALNPSSDTFLKDIGGAAPSSQLCPAPLVQSAGDPNM